MSKGIQTKGQLITGLRAKVYDSSLYNGWLIRSSNVKHLSLIDLHAGDRLLDVGCGTASIISKLYAKYGNIAKYYGIDPSSEMVQIARSKFDPESKNVLIETGVAENLTYKTNYFDWVVSSLTAHHIPKEGKEKMFKEMYRVLKPNGKLVLSDWSTPTGLDGKIIDFLWKNHAYVYENSTGILMDLLIKNNFKKIKTHYIQAGIVHHITALK